MSSNVRKFDIPRLTKFVIAFLMLVLFVITFVNHASFYFGDSLM
jgi:hypothetical protein